MSTHNYAGLVEMCVKIAGHSSDGEQRSALRDALLVGAGTATGAGVGYGTTALLKKRYGGVFKASAPEKRLKYLVPAATAVGAVVPLVHVLRQRAEARSASARKAER
jgi:hypothetical protein